MKHPELIYQRLLLRRAPISLEELSEATSTRLNVLRSAVQDLEERGLVTLSNEMVCIFPWYDEPRLELFLEIPRIEDEVFEQFCKDLDKFGAELRVRGWNVLRPYGHETVFEVLLGAAAGFTLAEFARGFLGQLGKSFSDYVGSVLARLRSSGVTEVELKGSINLPNQATVSFSVKGKDAAGVARGFEDIITKLCARSIAGRGELRSAGEGWQLTLHEKGDTSE